MKAQTVICGGGLMGLSTAYHLAKRGARVHLFEKECIGSHGSTRTSVGTMSAPMFYSDTTSQLITKLSYDLYSSLAANSESFRLNPCGRVYFASTDHSEMQLRRLFTRLRIQNPNVEFIESSSEIASRWSLINADDLKCAVYSPDDVSVDVLNLCRELANRARDAGALIYECCAVRRVLLSDNQRVYAVDTDKGLIETSNFINAVGIWSNSIPVKGTSLEEGVKIPAHPCIHTFLVTENLPSTTMDEHTPLFIDCDDKIYIGPSSTRTLCGGFMESDSPALNHALHDSIADWIMPCPEWDGFHSVLQRLLKRCPSLANLYQGDLVSGAEMYTPDKFPVVGESSQARGYFFANGFNGQGLPMAGGLGHMLADWILKGEPTGIDVSKLDASRFLPLHVNPQYLYERVPEVASNIFTNLHVTHQCRTARNLRMSPIHYQLKAAGAVFGEIMGYERPLWYHHAISTGEKLTPGSLYSGQDDLRSRPPWFASVMKEYEACRERVGILDMTSFAKFDISGPDVVKLLQSICSGNIDKPVGTTIYTGMQDDSGGYVTDCTMSRIRENAYFIVAPTVQQVRLANWLKKWIDEWNMDVQIQDVTGLYTALNIVGPSSRYLMHDITGKSMDSADFPSFTYRELEVGMADGIRAISVSHCGELGWVLYIPNEVAQNVYERLIEAGAEYSFQHVGYYTLRHLRIEKFYVYWGQDISNSTTPIECGRSFRVDFDKNFIGKKALLKQMDLGVTRRFVQLLVDRHKLDQDPWPQGGEPILRDGKLAGWTTSAAYGFTLGTQVCLGYVQNEEFGISQEFLSNGSFQIEIAGKQFPVRLNFHSPSLPMISSEHPHHYRPTQG